MGTGMRLQNLQELGRRLGELSAGEAQTIACLRLTPDILKEGWLPTSASASNAASSGKLGGYRGQRTPRRAGSLYRCKLRDFRTEQEAGSPGRELEDPR